MEAGTVSEWLVHPGDQVKRGQIVAVVETEKSTIEVEIFESGVLDEILVEAGQRVPVGTILARVVDSASRTTSAPPVPAVPAGDASRSGESPPPEKPATRRAPPPVPATPGHVVSPVVRHLAGELGVDLATLSGSGRGGTITRADVEQAARRSVAPREGRVRSSPLARRLAAERGVDLSTVPGSGPGGAVLERDVPPRGAPGTSKLVEQSGVGTASISATAGGEEPGAPQIEERQAAMRKAIGALMARSKREIPHYYLSTTIDLSAATAWLADANLSRPVPERLIMPVLLLKATARAIARVPEMNGFLIDDTIIPSTAVHVGVAVSLRSGGVIAPALHDTNTLTLDKLMHGLKDLVGRARKGILRSSEMSDPTITVTNLGDLGVEAVFGVIYPPQVALVGFGRVAPRPWASEGMLGVRPCVTATLSADHRASDGHRGGLFLAEIDRLLQEPEKL
jgi:pyruvate dehydrogenase E2 component (dihydrolipoamide acetyltransferase)